MVERIAGVLWGVESAYSWVVKRPLLIVRVLGLVALLLLVTLSAVAEPGVSPRGAGAGAAPGVVGVPGVPVQIENLAVITIEGPISGITAQSFQRRLKEAEDAGADAVVVDINTPGGAGGAMTEISEMLRDTPLYSIAWINPDAYSAGAVIALSCDEIVVSPNATMGDSLVIAIIAGGLAELTPQQRAKFTSPVLAMLIDSARRSGYDEVLVQAFVTLGVETWMVTDNRTGRRYFLTEGEYESLFGKTPPKTAARDGSVPENVGALDGLYADDAPVSGVPRTDAAADFVPGSDTLTPGMLDTIASNLEVVTSRPRWDLEDPANYTAGPRITDGTKPLTLKSKDLVDYGFARATIADDSELMAYTGATTMARLDMSTTEKIARYMTEGTSGFLIRAVLVVVFLLAMFIELSVPGIGVAGMIALFALAALVGPSMMVGTTGLWQLGAIVCGMVLLGIEIFILPGTGVAAVVGIGLLLAGLIGSFAGAGELFPGADGAQSESSLAWATATVLLAVFSAGIGAYLFTRYTKYVPIANKMILTGPLKSADRVGLDDESDEPLAAMGSGVKVGVGGLRVGDRGVTATPLMPSGTAEFDGRFVSVATAAGAGSIDPGTAVVVVGFTTFHAVVEAAGDGDEGGALA